MPTAQPELLLSVVIVSPLTYATVRKVVGCLAAQSLSGQMELIIVAPSTAQLNPDPADLERFGAHQVIEAGELRSVGSARAIGVRQARAPLVALCEEHCYPAPGWAAALVAAHDQPGVAAVAPAFHNANPDRALTWANFLVIYGPYLAPLPAGDYPDLPGHNSCYKLAALAVYGDQLERWLEVETMLHLDLRARGCRLVVEPRARVYHLNMSRLGSVIFENYVNGRFFASVRSRDWPAWRRAAYAAAWPLIAVVRFRRALNDFNRIRAAQGLGWRVLPRLALVLAVSAFGEMAGYLAGAGRTRHDLIALELLRQEHLAPGDRVVEPV